MTLSYPQFSRFIKPRLSRTVLASAVLLVSLQAHALSLGRLNVLSSLGEPLRAEVELQDFNPTDATALRLLAVPATAYSTLGQENNALASTFEVTLVSGPGTPRLLLSTRQPMTVAFVDFVMEANWPAGRSVREYTALFNDKPVSPAKAPVPVVATPVATSPKATTSAASADPARSQVVKAGDTAGNIAKAHAHSDVTLEQMLLAMLRENPQAFMDNNVNQLRAGAVLQIPQVQDAQSVAPGQARALLKLQNSEFQAWRQRLALGVPAREVPSASRESSGSVTTPMVSAPAPAADKLTLSKGEVAGQDALKADKTADSTADQKAEQTAKQLEIRDLQEGNREIANQLDELNKLSQEAAANAKATSPEPKTAQNDSPDSTEKADEAKPQDEGGSGTNTAAAQSGWLNTLIGSPWVPGLAAGLLAAMAGLAALRVRQRRQQSAPQEALLAPVAGLDAAEVNLAHLSAQETSLEVSTVDDASTPESSDTASDNAEPPTPTAWQPAATVDDPSTAPMSALPPGLPSLDLDLNLDLDVPADSENAQTQTQTQRQLAANLPDLSLAQLTPSPASSTPGNAPAQDLIDDEPSNPSSSSASPTPLPFNLEGLSLDLDVPTDLPALSASDAPAAPSDEALATKLALAQEFMAMGDKEGARPLVDEVLAHGSDELRAKAQALLFDLA